MKISKEQTQTIKGAAILFMIFHHMFSFPQRLSEGVNYSSILPILIKGNNIEYYFGFFGKNCVAIFLFISGYGLYRSFESNNNLSFSKSYERVAEFLRNYWIVLFTFVPIGMIFFKNNNSGLNHFLRYAYENPRYIFDLEVFIKSLAGFSYTYNGEWWFVGLYLEILLIFPLVMRIVQKKIVRLLLIIVLLQILYMWFGISGLKINGTIFEYLYFLVLCLPPFLVGVGAGIINKDFKIIKIDNRMLKLSLSIFQFLILMIIYYIASIKIVYKLNLNSFILEGFLAPFIIVSILNIVNLIKSEKLFSLLGKYSTYIWLIHTFFIYYFFQKYIYMAKVSVIIFIETVIISLLSAIILGKIEKIVKNKS